MSTPDDVEHLIYEAFAQLGWKADAQRLASRVARLKIGLPCEDEFSVVCSWLGRCALIHKLDQRAGPTSATERFQVPDLLAVFRVGSREVPVLIEVKSKQDKLLSFKPDYLNRLQNYAAALNLPLLVAWKRYGIWTLFDAVHMKVARMNFNISFGTAMSEGLLGVLAGDFSYTLAPDAGLHIHFRKAELLGETAADDGLEQQWKMVVEDAFHTDSQGQERRDLPASLQELFMAHDLDKREEHTDTHVKLHYQVGDDRNKFAHMALVRLLNWQAPQGTQIDWRALVGKAQPLAGITNFTVAVKDAMKEHLVTHIFHVQPQTMPPFAKAT